MVNKTRTYALTQSEGLDGKQYSTCCWLCCKCDRHYPERLDNYAPKKSFVVTCPNCRTPQSTVVKRSNTKAGHIFAILLAPLGLCLLPYLLPTCKRSRHFCRICGIYIATSYGKTEFSQQRRKAAIDDIAVRPITQFPVSLAEEAAEEHFNTYPNVRTITVRKGPQGLGIMIIEGKHTDVGQGIFISDIQEGSVAEKAGLEIGEMILAVNKEPLLGSNYYNAASLLKKTEGLVTLIVSNPTKKPATPIPPEDAAIANDVGANAIANNLSAATKTTTKTAALKPSAPPSRPTTPIPEAHADPLTCAIIPGKDTQVEIATDNKVLGIFFIGGKDTTPEGVIVVEVYRNGTADKDGRLQPGDQILEVNGVSLKDATHTTASQALRQTLPKMKLTIYRPEKLDYQSIEVDLIKKPGKGLGLSMIARKNKKGVYISEILSGGIADLDGRIMKGDLLVSVNGQNVDSVSGEEAGAILKTATGRVTLKFNRYKAINR